MTLTHILTFVAVALTLKWLVPARYQQWGISLGSMAGAGWMFWETTPGHEAVILFVFTLIVVVFVWFLISPGRKEPLSAMSSPEGGLSALLMLLGIVLLLAQLDADLIVPVVGAGVFTITGFLSVASLLVSPHPQESQANLVMRQRLARLLILGVILSLFALKIPSVAAHLGGALAWNGESLASSTPLVWLGFSYLAFRMIALLLDFNAGRIPAEGYSLRDVLAYMLFFPALTAGPIDRAQRFIPEAGQNRELDSALFVEGVGRILTGAAKKFIIADSLALVSMTPELIDQTKPIAGLWVLVYLYAFQIFFDFSGYSDIAIGLGRLLGITLPENFDHPYLQPNLQQFWQKWHMTLSTWFRIYFFTPFSRALMLSRIRFPQWSIIFSTQISTMVLIGLWHGVTINFAVWGLWHGVGLFAHKTLADNTKGWYRRVKARDWSRRLMVGLSVIVTFHYVALGWVFFALPDMSSSLEMMQRLLGG